MAEREGEHVYCEKARKIILIGDRERCRDKCNEWLLLQAGRESEYALQNGQ